MKTWSRVFAVLLLLTYIGAAGSHNAYGQARAVEIIIEKVAPWIRAPKHIPLPNPNNELIPLYKGPIERLPESSHPLPPPFVKAVKDVTDRVIPKVADFIGHDDHLIQILEEIGYLPLAPNADSWRAFPAVRKLETAYCAAEKANPGSGNDLLVHVVHKLANRYESIRYDDALKELLATQPNQSIQFAEIELSSLAGVRLPSRITEIINAIVTYCDNCAVLGGMRGILVDYLGATDAFDILRSTNSNSDALALAAGRLPPAHANARIKKIVETLQQNYETARHNVAFNEFIAQSSIIEISPLPFAGSASRPAQRWRGSAVPDIRP